MLRLVIVESPCGATTPEELDRNIRYAKAAVFDCIMRGEAPIASHLLIAAHGILDDKSMQQRRMGIEAGLAWLRVADAQVVYQDLGMSNGMVSGVARAKGFGVNIEYRELGPGWDDALV